MVVNKHVPMHVWYVRKGEYGLSPITIPGMNADI